MSGALKRPNISELKYKNLRFVLFDAPTDDSIQQYITEFKSRGVQCVVRACEPTYSKRTFEDENIPVTELEFEDGGVPSVAIVKEWLRLCKHLGKQHSEAVIGVHCIAGLGRTPVLIALSLIELGVAYEDAIEMIRAQRPGAINSKQLKFLKAYKPKGKCTIM